MAVSLLHVQAELFLHKYLLLSRVVVASLCSVDYFKELQHVLKAALTLGSSSRTAYEVVSQMALEFVDSVVQRLAGIWGMRCIAGGKFKLRIVMLAA